MEEIGRRLRAAREARGITLQSAEDETKIRRKYIEALEMGRVAVLPGEAYVKGFLRTYGNFLGLDGPILVEQYKLGKEPALQPEAGESAPQPAEVVGQQPMSRTAAAKPEAAQSAPPAAAVLREARAGRDPARRLAQRPLDRRPDYTVRRVAVGLAVALAVVLVAYFSWNVLRQPGAPKNPPSNPQPVSAPTPTPTPPPAPKPPDVTVTMTRGSGQDVLFVVTAKEVVLVVEPGPERVWMGATVDGQAKYDGFPTTPQEFKGRKISVVMGHMNGVSLSVNGQRFEKPLTNGPYTLILTGQP